MAVPDNIMDELQAFLVVCHYIEEITIPGEKPKILEMALDKLDEKLNPKMKGETGGYDSDGNKIPDEVIVCAAECQDIEWDKDLLEMRDELKKELAEIPDARIQCVRLSKKFNELESKHKFVAKDVTSILDALSEAGITISDIPF